MHILDQQAEIVHILTCDYENEMAGSEGQDPSYFSRPLYSDRKLR